MPTKRHVFHHDSATWTKFWDDFFIVIAVVTSSTRVTIYISVADATEFGRDVCANYIGPRGCCLGRKFSSLAI